MNILYSVSVISHYELMVAYFDDVCSLHEF